MGEELAVSSAAGGLANSVGSASVPQVMFNDEKREMGRNESVRRKIGKGEMDRAENSALVNHSAPK